MEDNPRDTLNGVEMFRGISEPAKTALVIAASSHIYARDDRVVGEGHFGDKVFIVGRGSVHVVKRMNTPEQTVLDTLGEKQIFGEMCLIEGVVRSASVVAAEPSFIYSIPNSSIYKLAVFYPDDYAVIIRNVALDLCRRLRRQDGIFAATAF